MLDNKSRSVDRDTDFVRQKEQNRSKADTSSSYPEAIRLHEFATASVKATGKYPTSKVMRTLEEDASEDTDEELLSLDTPHVKAVSKAKGNKILLKPVTPPNSPRTTRNMSRGRASSSRQQAHLHTTSGKVAPPIYDVVDQTPIEEFNNKQVGFEPRNIKDAQAHATWPIWQQAMEKEVSGLLSKGVWTEIRRNQVPADVKIMGSQFIFKDKLTGAKARLVVRGDQQSPKPTKDKTFSPTPSATEFRVLCALATEHNQPIHSCDVVQAFTQSNALEPGEELYVYLPMGYSCKPETV